MQMQYLSAQVDFAMRAADELEAENAELRRALVRDTELPVAESLPTGMTLRLAAAGMIEAEVDESGKVPHKSESKKDSSIRAAVAKQGMSQLVGNVATGEASSGSSQAKEVYSIANEASSQTQKKSRDTLRKYLQELRNQDPRCVFITRRINKLGFRSKDLLEQHYSRYGEVTQVFVAHSRVKPFKDVSTIPRTRPGNFGLVVMKCPEDVERVLAEGNEQIVAGVQIEVHMFERTTDMQKVQELKEEPEDKRQDVDKAFVNVPSRPPPGLTGNSRSLRFKDVSPAAADQDMETLDAQEVGLPLILLPTSKPQGSFESNKADEGEESGSSGEASRVPSSNDSRNGANVAIMSVGDWRRARSQAISSNLAVPVARSEVAADVDLSRSANLKWVLGQLGRISKEPDKMTREESLKAQALLQMARHSLRNLEEECTAMTEAPGFPSPSDGFVPHGFLPAALPTAPMPAPSMPTPMPPTPMPYPLPHVGSMPGPCQLPAPASFTSHQLLDLNRRHEECQRILELSRSVPVVAGLLLGVPEAPIQPLPGQGLPWSTAVPPHLPAAAGGGHTGAPSDAGNARVALAAAAAAALAAAAAAAFVADNTSRTKEQPERTTRHSGHSILEEPQAVRKDTLRSHLTEVSHEDQACIFIARRINKLGFRSREILRQHYSQYGDVSRVLVAHSKVKPFRDAYGHLRTRPGGLGLIVMQSAESVSKILAAGEEQLVAGHQIRVQVFERPNAADLCTPAMVPANSSTTTPNSSTTASASRSNSADGSNSVDGSGGSGRESSEEPNEKEKPEKEKADHDVGIDAIPSSTS
jgi:hypothetical protein